MARDKDVAEGILFMRMAEAVLWALIILTGYFMVLKGIRSGVMADVAIGVLLMLVFGFVAHKFRRQIPLLRFCHDLGLQHMSVSEKRQALKKVQVDASTSAKDWALAQRALESISDVRSAD